MRGVLPGHLSEGEPAVVRRDHPVRQDGETPCDQLRAGEADEQDVLEHTAAEGDALEPGSDAEIVSDVGDEAGNRDVEPGRDFAGRATGA